VTSVLVHRYPLTIVERHLDTFGHVNNATYLTLFEEARWDWITGRGFGLAKIQSTRTGPVVLEAQIRFRRELSNRQTCIIESRMLERNHKINRLGQKLCLPDGTVACDAEFVMGFFHLDERKLITVSPEWELVLTTPLAC
jgi:YbgC/YbaW family acyl-CoA thioester hydrolase